jgi:hypothetical protein
LNTLHRCPHCPQTSKRRWNLKNHINNKHDGIGQPISESCRNRMKHSKVTNVIKGNELFFVKSFRDKQRGLIARSNDRFQPKHFLQEYIDWVRPLVEFKRIVKELSGFSVQTPVDQPSFLLQGLPTNHLLQKKIIFKPILGYKVYTCDRCLSNILFPVYFYDENRDLFEKRHNCYPNDNINHNILDRTGILTRLNEESPNFLEIMICRSIITPRFDRLIAIPISNPSCPTALYCMQEKPVELQLDGKVEINDGNEDQDHLHWAERAILSGVTTLDERQLSEYLHLVRNSTFAFFRVVGNKIDNYYFMALFNLWP